jgi:hypothetical protein
VNPKAETVEELLGRRKALHMGMLKLAREDLSLALQAEYDSSVVQPQHLTRTFSVAFCAPAHPPNPHSALYMHTVLQEMRKHAACGIRKQLVLTRETLFRFWHAFMTCGRGRCCSEVGRRAASSSSAATRSRHC